MTGENLILQFLAYSYWEKKFRKSSEKPYYVLANFKTVHSSSKQFYMTAYFAVPQNQESRTNSQPRGTVQKNKKRNLGFKVHL